MNCTYSSFYISKVSVSASCSRMVDYIKCVADAWSCHSVFICEIRIVEETHAGTFPLWRYSARQISISLKWIGPNICHFLYPFILLFPPPVHFFFLPSPLRKLSELMGSVGRKYCSISENCDTLPVYMFFNWLHLAASLPVSYCFTRIVKRIISGSKVTLLLFSVIIKRYLTLNLLYNRNEGLCHMCHFLSSC